MPSDSAPSPAIPDLIYADPAVRDLSARVGHELGVSDWFVVTQTQVDMFAEATQDFQFIHVDPARARRDSPFGGTIAHGFLSLSLLSAMSFQVLPQIPGSIGINYGFDKVRFLTPVRVGTRVRGRFTLAALTPRTPTEFMTRYSVTVEIDAAERPALAAEWLTMTILKG
ncbi:MaoC family dehydratase [Pigmentiphaga aceris]|uniref:MaoC family dehydratase n=1 Tax=Pigmentiphaga aceris TaxID=1940612 RepID=A0A5C0AYY1_9BURK|nr:MaoC family dehydratase [Pigmentiphaga aceris]QEI06623.1 MaoC family dehydratase [Pigmentiphaga aceris]